MKIVINKCYGGFDLSPAGLEKYQELVEDTSIGVFNIRRNDPILVRVIEEMGDAAYNDKFSELKVVEVPDDVDWFIQEYDGIVYVAERHRTWS